MIENIKEQNSGIYKIPQAYSSYTKGVEKEYNTYLAVDFRQEKKNIEENSYTDQKQKAVGAKEQEALKKQLDIEKETVYSLMSEGEEVGDWEPLGEEKNKSIKDTTTRSKRASMNDKIDRLKEHTDNMYLYGVAHSKEGLTINDLYKGSYSGSYKKTKDIYTAQDINKVLGLNNLAINSGNQWAAEKLLQYGTEVSKESVVQMQNIKAAVESLEKYEGTDEEAEDKTLIKENKVLYSEMDMRELTEKLAGVTQGTIGEVIDSGKEITIGNLKEAMHKNTQMALKKGSHSKEDQGVKVATDKVMPQGEKVVQKEEAIPETNRETKIQQVKEQIKEITARLTHEAAQKISEKMPLESTELSVLAKELMAQEEETIQIAMKKAAIPNSEPNLNAIKQVMEAARKVAEYPIEVAGLELEKEEQLPLEDIHKALVAYEENETPTENRFGETLQKVENQIEGLLEENQIPVTKENIQAAKALIANQLEVNLENMENVSAIVQKVNTFVEEMTPYRVASLIKEGFNPYKASINTTLEWISATKLPALKGNIAEAIVALEDKGEVTKEQKDSLIGFYKILHAVEKGREEVVGYLYKNESPLTLEKLQEATKYVGKNTVLNKKIDDSFGELEEKEVVENNAKVRMDKGKEEAEKIVNAVKVLESMEIPLQDKNAAAVHKLNALLYPFIKNYFKQEMGKFEGLDTLPPSLVEKLEVIKDTPKEVVQFMEKQNIPVTISNLYWMQQVVEEPKLYGQMLEEHQLVKEGFPKSLEVVEEEIEALSTVAKKKKEQAMEQGDISSYKNYKQLEEMVALQKQFIQKEGFYQIPFMIHGEEKLVQLYVKKEATKEKQEREGLQAVIRYDTQNLGTITAYLNVKKDKMTYELVGESTHATAKLKSKEASLEGLLEKIGYQIASSTYTEKIEEKSILKNPLQTKRGDSKFEEIV